MSSSLASTHGPPTYRYPDVPIEPAEQIRVLEIQPAFHDGRFTDTLVCNLIARPIEGWHLENPPPWRYGHNASGPPWFEALSYTWGSWIDFAWISVNAQQVPVTRNLYLALRRLRKYYAMRRLWVDQICINQQDTDERSSQVQQMGRIFSRASKVLIWLGESALPFPERSQPFYYSIFDQLARAMEATTPIWWTRAWVVQERLLASRAEVVFGPVCMPWEQMLNMVRVDPMHNGPRFEVTAMAECFSRLSSKDNDLVTFGPFMYHMQCADPRDKIYSLLGLLKSSYRERIPVDYDKSVDLVFIEATSAEIAASKNLDILCLVSWPFPPKIANLPSWVVDFTFPGNERTARFRVDNVHDFGQDHRKAVPTWHASQRPATEAPRHDRKSRSLTLHGIRLDKVAWKAPLPGRADFFDPSRRSVPCRKILKKYDESTRDSAYPLRMCDRATSSALLDLLRARLLPDGGFPPALITELLLAWDPSMVRWDAKKAVDRWLHYAEVTSGGAAVFLTEYGLLGVGTAVLSSGDTVVLPYESRFAVALRQEPDTPDCWTFRGLVYVPGVKVLKLHDVEADGARMLAEEFVIK